MGSVLAMLPRLMRTRGRPIRSEPVFVLPGFGGGERSTRPLRRFLRGRGLHVEDWGFGVNRAGLDIAHGLEDVDPGWQLEAKPDYRGEAAVPLLAARVRERVRERSAALASRLTLIGWSLGGTIAREIARDAPEAVARVITLGAPVVGGPKYTAVARALARRGLDLDWIEAQIRRREARPITVPVTAVVSPSDGIVGYGAAIDRFNPRVRHVELDVPHLGMALDPRVWDLIIAVLEAGEVPSIG